MTAPNSGNDLQFRDVACSRGEQVIFRGMNFRLSEGGLLQVRGPNGSGKTSLLRMICGFLSPSTGKILWNGEETRSLGEDFHLEFAYVGHLNAIQDSLKVGEQLKIAARLAGLLSLSAETTQALEAMGLQGALGMPCRFLSQGQKRRLALARLRLGATRRLWILDEPFASLDGAGIEIVRGMLEAHLEGGGMVVITTHQNVSIGARDTLQIDLGQ